MTRIQIFIDLYQRILDSVEIDSDGEACPIGRWRKSFFYEVFPRIQVGSRDAVMEVLSSGEPISIPDFRLCCIYESFSSHIDIVPVYANDGRVEGARITLDLPVGCSFVNKLSSSQSLIDIGKNASMLAHGVRNPLNAIKGAVVYLKSRYEEDFTFLEFAQIIEQEIGNLDKFISGFLSASFDSFELNTLDLNDLLRKVEAVIAMQSQAADVEIEFLPQGRLPVRVNAFQVEHALFNLLNNSLQAMTSGGRIEVRSFEERQGERIFARVEIVDNGPGMPEAAALAQAPQNRPERKGRGFGLFIAREVFQNHGGSLEFLSEPGRGTTVLLSLPMEDGES